MYESTAEFVDRFERSRYTIQFIGVFNSFRDSRGIRDGHQSFAFLRFSVLVDCAWGFDVFVVWFLSLLKSPVWVATTLQLKHPWYVIFQSELLVYHHDHWQQFEHGIVESVWHQALYERVDGATQIVSNGLCGSACDTKRWLVCDCRLFWSCSQECQLTRDQSTTPINTTNSSLQLPKEVQWDWIKVCK